MRFNFDMRIDIGQAIASRIDFPSADVFRAVNYLALKIRRLHQIEIDNSEPANTCGSKVHSERCAQSARSDHQNAGGFQPSLTFETHLGHDQVAAITPNLVTGEWRQLVCDVSLRSGATGD